MFVATAALPGALRGTRGEVLPIKPGMLADALVPIERRTVLAWLLDPILRGLNDSVGRGARGAPPRRAADARTFALFGPAPACRSSRASELNECGLACLAAISGYFDGEPGLVEIRQLAVPSGRGETLLELRNLAERIGLTARGVKVGVDGARAARACPRSCTGT